jgi:hypothetical protein
MAPGGVNGILARLVGEQVGRTQGATVVIENRPGAGEVIGTETAARAVDHLVGTLLEIRAVQVEYVNLIRGTNSSMSIVRLLSIATASSSSGSSSIIFALANLVPLDDVSGFEFIATFRINLAIFDAVTSVLVEVMEADLLAFRRGRKQGDGCRFRKLNPPE